MAQLSHPNLARLHAAFVSRGELWLVMQLHAAGSCFDVMRQARPGGFDEAAVLAILREVVAGLDYLHSQGTMHRHLKSSNILLCADGAVRLTDFGLSGTLFEGGERRANLQTFVGSPCWMAPEVLEQSLGYDASADVW